MAIPVVDQSRSYLKCHMFMGRSSNHIWSVIFEMVLGLLTMLTIKYSFLHNCR